MPDKGDSWCATVELEKAVSLYLSIISRKYNVRVTTDAQFDKGKISIVIKDA